MSRQAGFPDHRPGRDHSPVATHLDRGPGDLQRVRLQQRTGQCQLWCQLRGLKGFIGDPHLNGFSKLLISHVALPGSNPSLSARLSAEFC